MPKLTKAIFGVPEGEVHPRQFDAGQDCPAGLEDAARRAGALADETEAPARKIKAAAKAPETK